MARSRADPWHCAPSLAADRGHDLRLRACARRDSALARVPGVLSASVNLATERATVVRASAARRATLLARRCERAGYAAGSTHRPRRARRREPRAAAARGASAALLSAPLVLPMLGDAVRPALDAAAAGCSWRWPRRCSSGSARASTAPAGRRCARGTGNMDLLVALGTTAAYGLIAVPAAGAGARRSAHLYFEASAVVITLVLLGKWLEARAKRQTTDAIRALQRAAARHAPACCATAPNASVPLGAGAASATSWSCAPASAFRSTAWCSKARSHVDESLITGESLPVRQGARATASPAARSTPRACCACAPRRSAPRRRSRASSAWSKSAQAQQGADPAPGRPRERRVRAGGARHRAAHVRSAGAGRRGDWDDGAAQRGRRAGHRLPVRARAGHADGDHGRHRRRPRATAS